METNTLINPAASNEQQQINRERFRKEAEALSVFGAPEIPIAIFLEEGAEAVRAAEKYAAALEAVGMPPELPGKVSGLFDGLRSTQVFWRTENCERVAEVEMLLEEARGARREAKLTCDLALLENEEGQHLLKAVEEGDTMPQVVASLTTLATIVTMFRPQFAAIHVNADELAVKLVGHAKAVQDAQFEQDSENVAADAKELRDRYYTPTLKALTALRAYATFAFRNEKSSRRRNLFLSGYIRSRNRKYGKAKAAEAARVEPAVVTAPAADDTVEQPDALREAA